MALLSVLPSALSPANSFQRILNKEFLQCQRTRWENQKPVNLLTLWLCKKTDEQRQEFKKVKVMLLRPGTTALCVGLSAWALVQRSTTDLGREMYHQAKQLVLLGPWDCSPLLEESTYWCISKLFILGPGKGTQCIYIHRQSFSVFPFPPNTWSFLWKFSTLPSWNVLCAL